MTALQIRMSVVTVSMWQGRVAREMCFKLSDFGITTYFNIIIALSFLAF